jgi:hypothetical protein
MTVYAEVQGSTLIQYPYTLGSLMAENPYTDFGFNPDIAAIFPQTTTAITKGYTLHPVTFAAQPIYDPATQSCVQNSYPTLINNVWTLEWTVSQMTPDQETAWQTQQKINNKTQAQQFLSTTDWSEIPSVINTSNTPHLMNASDFITYRNALRSIAVNPPVTVVWPIKPNEQWSS